MAATPEQVRVTSPFTQSLELPIRVTIKKKRHDVGSVTVPYPTLPEVAPSLPKPKAFEPEKKEKESDEEEVNQLPVYDDPILQWVQDAILEAVKREARNITSVVEDGKGGHAISFARDIPNNWAKLLEEHRRQGGEALAKRRAAIANFSEWLATLSKSQKAQTMAKAFFSRPQGLETVEPALREKFREAYLEPWTGTLSDEQLAQWEGHVQNVLLACESEETPAEDF